MGTSYSTAAAEVLQKWTEACLRSTNSQNTYVVKNSKTSIKTYFWEASRREHADGAVTGSVYRVTETREDGREMVRPAGAFRINGDGSVALAPRFLRDAAAGVRMPVREAGTKKSEVQVIDSTNAGLKAFVAALTPPAN